MKFYWFNKTCCVPKCFNNSTEGPGCNKEYYDFPAEPQARKKWLEAALIKDGEELRICEDHFQDGDVFRDKSNRKKLRINSAPTQNLPQAICTECFGAKKAVEWVPESQQDLCICPASAQPLQPVIASPNKRARMTWSQDEKKVIFKAIRSHGEVKKVNGQCRINWANVVVYCRKHSCYVAEKEIKIVWQNMKANAKKVFNKELPATKLDKKICKFLFGKTHKKSKKRSKEDLIESESSEDEDLPMPHLTAEVVATKNVDEAKEEKKEEKICAKEEESGDEYYSLSDVEQKFNVRIRPEEPQFTISLISSDEE